MTITQAPPRRDVMTMVTPRLTWENGRIRIEPIDTQTLRGEPAMPSVCSIDDCEKTAAQRGWCPMHYQRWRKNGTPHLIPRPAKPGYKYEACDRTSRKVGWCTMHYVRWRKYGDASFVHGRPEQEKPRWSPCIDCGTRACGERCRTCHHKANAAPKCSVAGCGEKHDAKGYCTHHYLRWKRHGSPTADTVRKQSREILAELEAHVTDACIEWDGFINEHGYGIATRDGLRVRAHRVMWERRIGPIPEGLHLDHLCCNRACVNVRHLEPVTPSENSRRVWIRYWARGGNHA